VKIENIVLKRDVGVWKLNFKMAVDGCQEPFAIQYLAIPVKDTLI